VRNVQAYKEGSIPRKAKKLMLIRPEHRFVLLHVYTGHDVVQMNDDILGPITNDHNKAPLLFLDSIADERGDARVTVLVNNLLFVEEIHCLTYTALRTMTPPRTN
jgi:hypothetical protein